MNFDDIAEGMHTARANGADPMYIRLGYEDSHDLLQDANFQTATGAPAGSNNQLGVVAGLDVQQENTEHMRIMLAEQGEQVEYHIF